MLEFGYMYCMLVIHNSTKGNCAASAFAVAPLDTRGEGQRSFLQTNKVTSEHVKIDNETSRTHLLAS